MPPFELLICGQCLARLRLRGVLGCSDDRGGQFPPGDRDEEGASRHAYQGAHDQWDGGTHTPGAIASQSRPRSATLAPPTVTPAACRTWPRMASSGANSGPTRVHCPEAPLIVGVGSDDPNCLGFDGFAPESVDEVGGTNAAGYEKRVGLAPAKFSVTRELPPRVTPRAAVVVIASSVVA